MTFIEIINAIAVLVGIPTIVHLLVNIGRKLQTLDSLETSIQKEIKPDLKEVRERFFAFEGKYAGYTKTSSPISLTPKGEKLLNESGLKEFIDKNKEDLLTECGTGTSMDTAYDIQEAVFDYFDNKLEFDPEFENRIKEYAFNDGTSMENVRRIGAIYFRDICLKDFNKDAAEIDTVA